MKIGVSMILVTALGVAVAAQVSEPGMRAIEAYRTALTAAEAGRPGSVERAFTAIAAVRETVLPDLRRLTTDAYGFIARQLRGVLINRSETESIQPDAAFYLNLANTKGDVADKAFFTALRATYPDSVWPVYVQRQTDSGGCTRFGTLRLVESYSTWTGFKRRFPTRYADATGEEIEMLHELLTDGYCACGAVADVERELVEFSTRFPQSPIREEVTSRLRDIRRGQSGIRANCQAQ